MGPRPLGVVNKFKRLPKRKREKRWKNLDELDLSKPWVTEAVLAEFKRRDELLRVAKETSKSEDWGAYRVQQEKCGDLYNAAKLEYIGQHPEEVRIPQLMPARVSPVVNTAAIDYTADVVL